MNAKNNRQSTFDRIKNNSGRGVSKPNAPPQKTRRLRRTNQFAIDIALHRNYTEDCPNTMNYECEDQKHQEQDKAHYYT